jgi:hypothetical protein
LGSATSSPQIKDHFKSGLFLLIYSSMKTILSNIKSTLIWMATTMYGALTLASILFIGGFTSYYYIENILLSNICYYIGWIGLSAVIIFILVGMIYAFIINPIAMYKSNQAAQKATASTSIISGGTSSVS